jgi:hypothetical protein
MPKGHNVNTGVHRFLDKKAEGLILHRRPFVEVSAGSETVAGQGFIYSRF